LLFKEAEIKKTMKVAIPIFGGRVSPRFDFAPRLLLFTVEEGEVVAREEVSLVPWNPWQRVEKLKELNVEALICGGIDGHSARLLAFNRIRVIAWVAGEAEEAMKCYLRGDLRPGAALGPVCRRRWRRAKNFSS
jgi:predicted Fe-Mo cluster-binding NifX family protein